MRNDEAKAVTETLREMRSAATELARGSHHLLTTKQAVEATPFRISAESLLAYPPFILPRIAMNPLAKRKTYLWDPRDLRDLQSVLRRWEAAIAAGALQEFRAARMRELASRNVMHARVA